MHISKYCVIWSCFNKMYHKSGYVGVGIVWPFSVKMRMFNFGVSNFGAFQKMIVLCWCFSNGKNKINTRDQSFLYQIPALSHRKFV